MSGDRRASKPRVVQNNVVRTRIEFLNLIKIPLAPYETLPDLKVKDTWATLKLLADTRPERCKRKSLVSAQIEVSIKPSLAQPKILNIVKRYFPRGTRYP